MDKKVTYDLPAHRKFGYEYNREMDEIEAELIAKGYDKGSIELTFAARKVYAERHKNDLTYRQRQELARQTGEKWVTPAPSTTPVNSNSIKFTDEEIEYLKEKLAGANYPTALDILDKLSKIGT